MPLSVAGLHLVAQMLSDRRYMLFRGHNSGNWYNVHSPGSEMVACFGILAGSDIEKQSRGKAGDSKSIYFRCIG